MSSAGDISVTDFVNNSSLLTWSVKYYQIRWGLWFQIEGEDPIQYMKTPNICILYYFSTVQSIILWKRNGKWDSMNGTIRIQTCHNDIQLDDGGGTGGGGGMPQTRSSGRRAPCLLFLAWTFLDRKMEKKRKSLNGAVLPSKLNIVWIVRFIVLLSTTGSHENFPFLVKLNNRQSQTQRFPYVMDPLSPIYFSNILRCGNPH